MSTPSIENIPENTIIPPDGGWSLGVFLVEVAVNKDNVIHRALLQVTYLDSKPDQHFIDHFLGGEWDDVNGPLFPNSFNRVKTATYDIHVSKFHYVKCVKKVLDDKELQMPAEKK